MCEEVGEICGVLSGVEVSHDVKNPRDVLGYQLPNL